MRWGFFLTCVQGASMKKTSMKKVTCDRRFFTKSGWRAIFHKVHLVFEREASQGRMYIIGGGTIRHGTYQQRTFNSVLTVTRSRAIGKISICPNTFNNFRLQLAMWLKAVSVVGLKSFNFAIYDFISKSFICFSTILCASVYKYSTLCCLLNLMPKCWMDRSCLYEYTMCIHIATITIRKYVMNFERENLIYLFFLLLKFINLLAA